MVWFKVLIEFIKNREEVKNKKNNDQWPLISYQKFDQSH